MLTELEIENFRGFKRHTIPFKGMNVIVGKNNAGKSTIVEALRLVSIVVTRYRNLTYKPAPKWLGLPLKTYCVSPSLKGMGVNFENAFHRYGNPPGIITAKFSDKSSVKIYLGEGEIYAVILDDKGESLKTRHQANLVNLTSVEILPQITPLQKKEVVLSPDYIKNSLSSSLSSSHFRNQLNLMRDFFPHFKESVEKTWSGVSVQSIANIDGRTDDKTFPPNSEIFLYIRNEDFVAEVSLMGHGLQMWLQTMWFLSRCNSVATVILDEPDVYMHADLQRRLIRYLKGKFLQVILTTHSIEIMAEIDPSELLVIDRHLPKSKFADSIPVVQNLIEKVGSIQNIHLAKLWYSRKLILVEGEDLKFLKQIQNICFPDSNVPFDAVPNISIGGWGGWNYAVGSHMLIKNALDQSIITYCLFDSDYHSEEEKSERKNDALNRGVQLHIWSYKEIENYLLNPDTICRLINRKIAKRTLQPTPEEIQNKIQEIASNMEDEVFDGFSSEFLSKNRSIGVSGANKKARQIIKGTREKEGNLVSLVSGKNLISKLSKWSQDEFGVSFNSMSITKEMSLEEVPEELVDIVSRIERGENFG